MQYTLYVVSKDGRPVFHYSSGQNPKSSGEITEATLFSGIISAIQSVMKEINAGELSNFSTEKNKIYVKNQGSIAFVVILPLSSDYQQSQMDELFTKLVENLPLDVNSPDLVRTTSEDQMLNTIVKMLFEQWHKDHSQSKASKKMKEDLW